MTRTTPTGWRRALAAALVLVTILAGGGRAVASVAGPAAGLVASDLRPLGLRAPICHAGAAAPASPDAPPAPECCDACALLAPAMLPSAPPVPTRTATALPAERGALAAPAEGLPRQRGPRQSQGPPLG